MTKYRTFTLATVVTVHLVVLAIALQVRTVVEPAAARAIATVAVVDHPAALPAVAPPMTEISFDTMVPMPEFTVGGGGTDNCALDTRIAQALVDDPRASAALAALPRDARSVANTAMLWDGRWSTAESAPAAVRAVVAAVVRDATPQCRSAPLIGPRLVFVTTADGLALAFGSGRWSWSDLLR